MAFNFQAYRNPYVSTIAELLGRGEDAKAKALVDVANTQAQAMQARAQLYGGAVESVGKMVSGFPDAIQAQKRQALNDQLTLANLTRVKGENDKLAGEADDRAAFDFAGSSGAAVEEGFTGPLPEGSPMPTREQTLARLPWRLRQQAEKSYAELDASAQGLAASKSAQAQNEAQTAQLDADRRDKQQEYVSTIANQLREFKGSLPSIRQAYSHAQSSGLDPKAMEQVDAIYKQLESAATDEERVMIINAIPLHRNTIEANRQRNKDRSDAELDRLRIEGQTESNRLSRQTQKLAIEESARARRDRADYTRQQDEAKAKDKALSDNAEIVANEQKLYAALELRKPESWREEGAGFSVNNNMSEEARVMLAPFMDQSSGAANTTRSLTPIEFINAKNEIDKSIRARRGLPPLAKPRYELPFEPRNVRGLGTAASIAAPGAIPASPSGAGRGGMVRMVAPNGQEKDVPADQVAGFERLGAKRK